MRYTILFADDDKTDDLNGIYDDIDIISIRPSKIESSINELLL